MTRGYMLAVDGQQESEWTAKHQIFNTDSTFNLYICGGPLTRVFADLLLVRPTHISKDRFV